MQYVKKNSIRIVLLLLAVTLGNGCENAAMRVKQDPAFFQSLPPEHQRSIQKGEIRIGFTPGEVYLAWGWPNHKQISENSRGRAETWIYTRRETDPHYLKERWYNAATNTWEYVNDPNIRREYIVKDAVFISGRVDAFNLYPDSPLFNTLPE